MKYIATIISIIALAFGVFALMGGAKNSNFGVESIPSYYFGATNSSSTVPTTATTSNPILSLDANRKNARICNIGTATVFLHQSAISTTTGVRLDEGIALSPFASSTNVCVELPGFRGYLFGISTAATKLTVSSWK